MCYLIASVRLASPMLSWGLRVSHGLESKYSCGCSHLTLPLQAPS